MCGIVYVRRTDGKNAAKMVAKRYQAQKTRGSQGFGFIAISNGKIVAYKRATTEKEILDMLEAVPQADEVIFHHRMPTSTENFAEAAHPIMVSNRALKHDYYVVHNGVISNDDELKAQHEKEGFRYNTELVCKWKNRDKVVSHFSQYNDSEALAIELAKDMDNGSQGIEVKGSIAFICLQVKKHSNVVEKLFFGRNLANPLKVKTDDIHMAVTSEGDGPMADTHTLFEIDYKTNQVAEKPYKVGVWGYLYRQPDYTREADYHAGRGEEWDNDYGGVGSPRGAHVPTVPWQACEDSYERTKAGIGFQVDRTTRVLELPTPTSKTATETPPVENANEDGIISAEEYIELCIEYDEIQKQLANFLDKDCEEAQFLEDRRLDIEDEIRAYDNQKLNEALESY